MAIIEKLSNLQEKINLTKLDIVSLALDIFLILTGSPIIGIFLLAMFAWIKLYAWQKHEERRARNEEFLSRFGQIIQSDLIDEQTARELLKQIAGVPLGLDPRMSILPLPSDVAEFKTPLLCTTCKFYHGRNGIICAVHPMGLESESCIDYEISNRE